MVAHILLGSFHSDPILDLLRRGESARLAACLRTLIATSPDPAPDLSGDIAHRRPRRH
jgi:hypothetical protein